MRTKVTLDDQPLDYIRRQPPEARKAIRDALHHVEAGRKTPVALEDELDGFYKLRVGSYRLILQATPARGYAGFRVVFAEKRKVVYELFSQILGLG
jgi:mRNA-degrading endonuclease RelE of RelBE toxin-antitoxin system